MEKIKILTSWNCGGYAEHIIHTTGMEIPLPSLEQLTFKCPDCGALYYTGYILVFGEDEV